MAIELMTLRDDGVSLEFASADFPVVRDRLVALFGSYTAEWGIDFATIDIAGERLVLNDEWDRPCLLATTPRGRDMLRALADPVAVAAE